MYQYLQNVQAYIGPPVTAVFLLGILWKRINAQASIVTLSAGLVLLIVRLSSEIYFQSEISSGIVVDSVFFEFATINFSHMAIFIFFFGSSCVTVSILTDEPDYSRIKGLSFGTTTREMISKEKELYKF